MTFIRKLVITFVLFGGLGVIPVDAGGTGTSDPSPGDPQLDSGGEAPSQESRPPGDDPPTEGGDETGGEKSTEEKAGGENAPAIPLGPSSFTYPTLAHRDLGQPVVDVAGRKKVWPHKLPIFGQKVLDLGIDFPDPYGLSVIGTYLSQDLEISDLRVSFDEGQSYQPFDWVQFPGSEASNYTVETKVDAWLFPFMNLFALAGYVDGAAVVPVGLPVEPLLDTLGHGHLCPDGPLRPDFCNDVIMLDAYPDYDGYNVGLGTVLAMGWKSFYLAVPITYVWSDMSNLEQTVGTLTVEALFGHTFQLGGGMLIEAFIGGMYLDASTDITNTTTLPLSEIDPALNDVDIHYKIKEFNKDKWNYIVGGQFQFSEHWAMQCQIGFGGSRQQYTLTGVYRW
jgi:hypothetical protein